MHRQNKTTIRNMNTITTKYGVFNAVENGNGGTSLFMGKAKICEFPKVAWWNLDAIEKGLEEHHELIEKRIAERVKENDMDVTRDNAKEIIGELIKVFGKEQNGFFASRLKQCYNKLN